MAKVTIVVEDGNEGKGTLVMRISGEPRFDPRKPKTAAQVFAAALIAETRSRIRQSESLLAGVDIGKPKFG